MFSARTVFVLLLLASRWHAATAQAPNGCDDVPIESAASELRFRAALRQIRATPRAASILQELTQRNPRLRNYSLEDLMGERTRRVSPAAFIPPAMLNHEISSRSILFAGLRASQLQAIVQQQPPVGAARGGASSAPVEIQAGVVFDARQARGELARRPPPVAELTLMELRAESIRRATDLGTQPETVLAAEVARRASALGAASAPDLLKELRAFDPYADRDSQGLTRLPDFVPTACPDAQLARRVDAEQRRVFGEDVRFNLREATQFVNAPPGGTTQPPVALVARAVSQALNVAVLMSAAVLSPDGPQRMWIGSAPLFTRSQPPLCAGERYRDDASANPPTCTGFLLDRRTLVTARHCTDQIPIGSMRVVFGNGLASESVPTSNIFTVTLVARGATPADDWAVLTLDRDGPGTGLSIDRVPQLENTRLYVIGHPNGMAVQIAPTGRITPPRAGGDLARHFYASITTFGGSSGSPVLSVESGLVVGIVRGADGSDFRLPVAEPGVPMCCVVLRCQSPFIDCLPSPVTRISLLPS